MLYAFTTFWLLVANFTFKIKEGQGSISQHIKFQESQESLQKKYHINHKSPQGFSCVCVNGSTVYISTTINTHTAYPR